VEEIGHMVAWLASSEAAYVNGTEVVSESQTIGSS
jgi:NAD(P)-dependent dehydrogenase (short-subunit alcohol dehydrogenase family)